ncbi:MAG: thiamine phosphate synthase [Thalassobaculum sp.]|uniref:thiamine phosphate synthase n=1 Tax=Thalassobaculum sp. TaxID=2022740 RepID=UPI0032EBC505
MSHPPYDLTLYLVTDPVLIGDRPLEAVVAAAVEGGVTMVQLRDKTAESRALIETAERLIEILRPQGVPLLVNDRVDVALAAGADGVHVGQSDMPAATVRRLLGDDAIIGVSVTRESQMAGIDPGIVNYLGVGPLFATSTKGDAAAPLSDDAIRRILARTRLRTVGIGGIDAANAHRPKALGLGGIAVVSAICAAADPEAAARALREAFG